MSLFLTTNIFEDYPESFELATTLGNDFHSHSHTHNTKNIDSQFEIKKSKSVFNNLFKQNPLAIEHPRVY